MKEEIELATGLMEDIETAYSEEDMYAVSEKARAVKTLMKSIELSAEAYNMGADGDLEEEGPEEWEDEEEEEENGEDL